MRSLTGLAGVALGLAALSAAAAASGQAPGSVPAPPPDPCTTPPAPGASRLAGAAHAATALEAMSATDPVPDGGFRRGRFAYPWATCEEATGARALPVSVRTLLNSGYAVDRYNGGLWGGRGWSLGFTAGGAFSWKGLAGSVSPEFAYHQNRDFATVDAVNPGGIGPLSTLAYPWYSGIIDWPQRFGAEPGSWILPGESWIEFGRGAVAVGASTESLWWGPALRYPLLFSNAGPGFPHVYLRSADPLWIGIGYLSVQGILGRLDESEYFTADPADDLRALATVGVAFQPGFASSITLGGALVRHRTLSGTVPGASDFLAVFKSPFSFLRGEDDDDNGLTSLFIRWNDPGLRLALFLEYGREDFVFDFNDFLTDPDHSRAYTAGFRKGLDIGDWSGILVGELTQLSPPRGAWYINGDVIQGHTHRGQLLGAYVGPGSEGQYLSARFFAPEGDRSWGAYVERVRWDESSYERDFFPRYGFRGHDVEVRFGGTHTRRIGALSLDGEAGIAFRRNRGFVNLDGVRWEFPWRRNLELDLTLSWHPAG